MTRQKLNFNNQTNYHLRRANYYMQNALAVCSDDKIHPTDGNPHIDPLAVIIAYRAYNDTYAEDLYNQIISSLPDSNKMKFTFRVGDYNLWDNM